MNNEQFRSGALVVAALFIAVAIIFSAINLAQVWGKQVAVNEQMAKNKAVSACFTEARSVNKGAFNTSLYRSCVTDMGYATQVK